MTDQDQTTDLAVIQERCKTFDRELRSILPKVEEVTKTIESIKDQLIARINNLETANELNKSKIEDLAKQNSQNIENIQKLQEYKNYLKGSIATIIGLFVLFVGLLAKGIITLKT